MNSLCLLIKNNNCQLAYLLNTYMSQTQKVKYNKNTCMFELANMKDIAVLRNKQSVPFSFRHTD